MRRFTTAFLLFAGAAWGAEPDGAALYKTRCSMCHDASGSTRAPAPSALRQMSPENIVKSLESGMMREQGSSMTGDERRVVAEFLTAKKIGEVQVSKAGMCADLKAPFSMSGESWNGWSPDLQNTRFQKGGLTGADVPHLKLKWAFGFPGTFASNGQP